jgi:hypothetical protein
MFLKDSQSWTTAEYAYWKAFCESCEWFHEGFGVSHPNYPTAKEAVERYESFYDGR